MKFGLIVHGGAIPSFKEDYSDDLTFLRILATSGLDALRTGGSALFVAKIVMRELESSGRFIAGRGSSPNSEGRYELDACLIDGSTGKSGSVAALTGYKWPSQVAGAVLEHEREPLWIGEGAGRIASKYGCDAVDDDGQWYEPRFQPSDTEIKDFGYSTAGVVVLDQMGRLSAGTTTGGLIDKAVGRVGDSPIIGAGTWADKQTAVSCTGDGQAFYRSNASGYIGHRQELLDEELVHSARSAIEKIGDFKGTGAVIALGRQKAATIVHNSAGVKCGWAFDNEEPGSGLTFNGKP